MIEDYEYHIIGHIINAKDKRALVVEGIDFGYANPSYKGLPIIKETKQHFLCRIRGTGARISLGAFSYSPPRYIIFTKDVVDGKNVVKNPLGDWDIEYTREDMYEKKQIALKQLDKIEKE
jgi:hypothetical protein